jgi:short-subunit dehydrogenase
LERAKDSILKSCPSIKVEISVFDFFESTDEQTITSFASQFQKYDISVLVNNAGISYGGLFEDQPEWQIKN